MASHTDGRDPLAEYRKRLATVNAADKVLSRAEAYLRVSHAWPGKDAYHAWETARAVRQIALDELLAHYAHRPSAQAQAQARS